MYRRILMSLMFLSAIVPIIAQENDTTRVELNNAAELLPDISYSYPRPYKIAEIKVTGADNYDDYVLISLSGLSVGDVVEIPGDEITDAINRFLKQGLFSNVRILYTKMTDTEVWLEIQLTQHPKASEINYHGIKKGEREDLQGKLHWRENYQVTQNSINRARTVITRYFDDKGFKNVEVRILQKDDPKREGFVIVDIYIDKKEKTKVNQITFYGNEALSDASLKKAMKKTNEKFSLKKRFATSFLEMFSTKKFTSEEYENDKQHIIDKYNEHGYRDAVILADTVVNHDDKTVNVSLTIDEGEQFFIKNIQFVGNTKYPTEQLQDLLDMRPGEVYNQTKLVDRLYNDDDAVSNLYYNNGYMFFNADPVEIDVQNDSITLEIRMVEGAEATINRVIINGNDRLYEDVIRRELRTKPGMLFSKEDVIRSAREIAQTQHFDPENMDPRPIPNPEDGTVDIEYNLVSKANDQIEFSAGWGQTGIIGKLSLKFTNFSLKNFLNPSSYRGIIPQGEGQTLTISGQTNARYYQSYSISFYDPWFGGKRPNMLSVGIYYSKQTSVSTRYLSNNSYYDPYSMYGGGMYGSGMYGNSMYGYPSYNYELAYDPDKSFSVIGASVGYGKRLNWPDDYFQFMATLNYQLYMLRDWNQYFVINEGNCHNINLELLLQRNSIDNPLYTRYGSQFSLSVSATPPYSAWDGKDYKNMTDNDPDKFRFIEYHKWKFKSKIFVPLAPLLSVKRTPVLMARAEFGFLGYYNSHKRSPFETFYVGGDGMSGYSSYYATETVGLRGYDNGALADYSNPGHAYSRFSMEIRYPFILEPSSTIYGLAFVEAGNAWQDVNRFRPFDLKRSAGVGVRIFLPMIGLMGIDWAYGFDTPTGRSEKGGSQFHFIIGQEF